MKRILFIINSPIIGGAERHTLALAQAIRAFDFDTKIFALKNSPRQSFNHKESIEILLPRSNALRDSLEELRREIENGRYDLVVAANERPCLAAVLATRQLGKRRPARMGVLHSSFWWGFKESINAFIHYPFYRQMDEFVFISHLQKQRWQRHGLWPKRSVVIRNGVDTKTFSPQFVTQHRAAMRRQLNYQPDDYVIVLSAVMRPEKNHGQALRAVARLRNDGIPAKLLLVGDGPCRSAIEGGIAAWNLTNHVAITGFVDDVRSFIAAADVGLICSYTEALSLAALEVLGMGLPMVMSNVGGSPEIVDGSCGRLFEVGDDVGLVAGLKKYVPASVRHAAGAAARQKVEIEFDESTMALAYASRFKDVIDNNRLTGRGP